MAEREDELWEYIEALQTRIDRLVERDDRRLQRIGTLEAERAELRQRRGDRRRRPKPESTAESVVEPPSPIEVPGVGPIAEPQLPRLSPRLDLTVATILDPFSETVFGPEFRLDRVGSRSVTADLERIEPDLLLVESAYGGHDGSWVTRIARFGSPSVALREAVDWCRARGVPTVFWNKEDPINFDWFEASASLFDHVFTVDGDMVDRYRATLGHDRVGVLPFFAQPAFHFPGDPDGRTGSVAFAGSYFAAKHPERREQVDIVVDPAREFDLHIFDRHGTTDDPRFAWPDRYRPHIVGSLSYMQTTEAYRRYRVFLNVNTVTTSKTMCARRVFELAACGTPIVSGPARALEDLERDGAVAVVRTPEETRETLRRLLDDDEQRQTMAEKAAQWVSDGNLASHRVDKLLTVIGRG